MLKQLWLTLLITGTSLWMRGQTSHSVTLQSNQDSALIAFAGTDTVFSTASDLNNFFLGGNPSASGGSAPYRYEWLPSAPLNNDTLSNPQIVNQTVMQQTYQLMVFDARNCNAIDTVTVTLDFLSSVEDQSNASTKLYPNPASSQIIFESPFQDGNIRLIDSHGKLIDQTTVTDTKTTLNIEHLPVGIYVLEYTRNGSPVTKKFIIQ